MNQQLKPVILHVIQTLGSGGAERLLVTYLSQPQLKDAFDHIVVLTDIDDPRAPGKGTFLVETIEQQGIEVIGLGSPGPRHFFQCIKRLKQIIKNRKIQLVHSHLIWSNIAGRIAGKIANVPVISSFHNSDYDPQVVASFSAPKWKQKLIKYADAWTAGYCDSVSVAVSKYVAKHVEEHLGLKSSKIEIIYNPIDVVHIQPRHDSPRLQMRQELSISPDAKMILSVGRVTDQKGIIELVEAFDQVCAELPAENLNLVIVGAITDQKYNARLNTKIESLQSRNHIYLVGPRSDVGDWLAAADVFAFPTKFEGLGIALAEAMAAALPCVATNVGPIPELIENEKTGLLVSLNQKPELVSAIKRLIIQTDFAKSLGLAASKYIRSEFTATAKAEQLYDLYCRILKKD